ncbi:unnamed protein product, partial [Pneumocystis jirovecii]
MELVTSSLSDSKPWSSQDKEIKIQRGRMYFSQVKVVRTKPGKNNSIPTNSKSCSDKLLSKEILSLLNAVTIQFFCPKKFYIDAIILPEPQIVAPAIKRAFYSRVNMLHNKKWEGGYSFKPFCVYPTTLDFCHKRSYIRTKPCPLSLVIINTYEQVLCRGIKQGAKYFSKNSHSMICKYEMLKASLLNVCQYSDLKKNGLIAEQRKQVKQDLRNVLSGWEVQWWKQLFS